MNNAHNIIVDGITINLAAVSPNAAERAYFDRMIAMNYASIAKGEKLSAEQIAYVRGRKAALAQEGR